MDSYNYVNEKLEQIGELKKGLNPPSIMDLSFGSAYMTTAIKTGIVTGVISLAVSTRSAFQSQPLSSLCCNSSYLHYFSLSNVLFLRLFTISRTSIQNMCAWTDLDNVPRFEFEYNIRV